MFFVLFLVKNEKKKISGWLKTNVFEPMMDVLPLKKVKKQI
jgi:hypothetical protein